MRCGITERFIAALENALQCGAVGRGGRPIDPSGGLQVDPHEGDALSVRRPTGRVDGQQDGQDLGHDARQQQADDDRR